MEGQSHGGNKKRLSVGTEKAAAAPATAETTREKLRKLCECKELISNEEVLALSRINREVLQENDDASSSDEVDEILEAEYRRLNDALDLPVDTYSLTKIKLNLPKSVKYGVRSGLTHGKMQIFSPLSRGLQGPAIAIAAFATTALVKARCWNESIIDGIVDDGDSYYCESYEGIKTDDRKTLTVLDLKTDFIIRKTHRVYVTVDEPLYAGTFRSETPTDLHLAKALELFFKRYDAGVLTSAALNIAIWKDSKYLNIFDSQPRKDNLLPTDGNGSDGSAKLIVVRDLIGLIFVILEKSDVKNEYFVLYGLGIRGIERLPLNEDDPEEPERTVGKPRRRPSGYIIQNKYRALVQGSFHLTHEILPVEFRGHGHLVVALAALIYSRLVNANKWTTAIIDLMFNQAHIYLVDLARVLEKKLDETFELKIDDVMSDVILGVYAAKVKVRVNVVPGLAKKGKATIDAGVRDFFASNNSAILEIKKKFYAVWKEGVKYYLLDPFACDDEGFRVDPADDENVEKYNKAAACVTMNSSINELIETILENTGNKEKDPFILHGLTVLYVKTRSVPDGPFETVIYREKKTNRRPLAPKVPEPEALDDCKIPIDTVPKPRPEAERTKDACNLYPELMRRVEEYAMKDDEPTTFVESEPETRGGDSRVVGFIGLTGNEQKYRQPVGNKEEQNLAVDRNQEDVEIVEEKKEPDETIVDNDESPIEEEVKFIKGYSIINPHRIILHGSKNCLAEDFEESLRGRQGLALALTAIAYSKIKDPTMWRNVDVDQILRVGNRAHSDIVTWIREGSPEETAEGENDEEGEEDEDEEKEEEEEEENEDDEIENATKSRAFKGILKGIPSHIEISMLRDKIKLGENEVTYKKKESVLEGDANPLANLGEAMERYFKKYNEAILENKRLMYGIWKYDDKYFLLNPYGSDEEGWRLRDYPASLVITDTINELTDTLHGILEFNDRIFSLHFVGIESIQPGNKYVAPIPVEVPQENIVETYRTRFLPVTDKDLFVPQLQTELQAQTTDGEEQEPADKDEEDEVEDEEEEEEAEEKEQEDDEDKEDEENKDLLRESEPETEKPLEDPLLEIDEQEYPDAPDHLNLSLLTGTVKIEDDQVPNEESSEILANERLKYNHPPPYVVPPKEVLCVLLEAKKGSRSMHSLISRFSIDSKLAVEAAATDLPAARATNQAAIENVTSSFADEERPVKMIKLPPTKYLFSRIPLYSGVTPLRAIDEKFIRDVDLDEASEEQCRKKKLDRTPEEFVNRQVPEDPIGIRITPEIIPLGPTIETPTPKKKYKRCADHPKARKCKLTDTEREDKLLEKILCNTEDVLFDIIFPRRKKENVIIDDYVDSGNEKNNDSNEHPDRGVGASAVRKKVGENEGSDERTAVPETLGFFEIDENVGIIEGNTCLQNRNQIEDCHFKACFFAAILCILAKVRIDVNRFRGTILDGLILASDKIYRRTGKLRYKPLRWFRNVTVLGAKCNLAVKQSIYGDPESCEADELSRMLESYIGKNQSGILVLSNASYAFWFANGEYYLFDPYGCDERGFANESGYGCLLKFSQLEVMVKRIKDNNGASAESSYRIYSLSIAHMESVTVRGKRTRREQKRLSNRESEKSITEETSLNPEEQSEEANEPRRELSLTELAEWLDKDETPLNTFDITLSSGFAAVKNHNASAFEVLVVENDITRSVLAPLKKLKGMKKESEGRRPADASEALEPCRKKPYDRKFAEPSSLCKAIDLCVIAWSCIHDPTLWGVRTIRGIYEASKDLTFDSLLAARDSTVTDIIDDVLTEFSIANYSFRAVFAPLHHGTLYALEGWNLAMSLKKLFDIPIYSGAIIVCGNAHIGVTRKGLNYYAWWAVPNTKNLRIITSEVLEDFLKLIVKAINEREEKLFLMRVVTISYARKLDPDCSDIAGLHEIAIPVTSLPQIHRKESPPYDLDAVFRSTVPTDLKPIFVLGTVALRNRDSLTEPKVKRCYFVALLSVMVKRDIAQSPVPGIIDKIIQVAENLYKEFDEPKYHTEHILRNVTVMNRIFDFRDCATSLFIFKENPNTGKTDYYPLVRKQLKIHLKKYSDGIIHFTNCCYGFWYSRSTNAYYYIDPYPCNSRGTRRVDNMGKGCLAIFSSICQMARQMCVNRFEDTTGFFIHRLHVESINVLPFDGKPFQEDPMWVYLDYHWSFCHSRDISRSRVKTKRRRNKRAADYEDVDVCEESEKEKRPKPLWNNYVVEVANLIYSVWGTLGCYDTRFGDRAGKNQAAICLAILAMRYLCHPSKWGAAILDSAIICGDSYYTESSKSSARRGSEYSSNRFNLQSCFKVFPHIWSVEFCADMCGILYGSRERPCLATILKLAFETSSNLVLECGKVTLSVLSCEDGFYVADPCWTGPPLFSKNHGAVYALRCTNFNALIYAITKILNTNHRLEFRITPVMFSFGQEICKFTDRRGKTSVRKEILVDAMGMRPGTADGPDTPVPGAITVPNEDAYLSYRRNMRIGMLHGKQLEDPAPIPSPKISRLSEENVNNLLISTAWHLNVGQTSRKRRSNPPLQPSVLEPDPGDSSITKKISLCDGHPRIIDLVAGKYTAQPTKFLTRRKVPSEASPSAPSDCLPPRHFLHNASRREFNKRTKEMADEAYKSYKHRVVLDVEGDIDAEDSSARGVDEEKRVDDEVVPVESEIVNNLGE